MFLEKYGYLLLFIGETITIIGYLIRFLFFLIFPEAYQNFVKRHQGITEEEAEELLKYLDQLRTDQIFFILVLHMFDISLKNLI